LQHDDRSNATQGVSNDSADARLSDNLLHFQAESGREPAWYNLLPLAAVAIARQRLGVKDKEPQFREV